MDLRLNTLEPTDFNRAEGVELDDDEEESRLNEIVDPVFVVRRFLSLTTSLKNL
jgi:hypothetical protein